MCDLRRCPVVLVRLPHPAGSLGGWFCPAHLFERRVGARHDVDAIKGDRRPRQMRSSSPSDGSATAITAIARVPTGQPGGVASSTSYFEVGKRTYLASNSNRECNRHQGFPLYTTPSCIFICFSLFTGNVARMSGAGHSWRTNCQGAGGKNSRTISRSNPRTPINCFFKINNGSSAL